MSPSALPAQSPLAQPPLARSLTQSVAQPSYAPYPSAIAPLVGSPPRTDSRAVAAIILGVASLGLAFFGALAGIPAIILGSIARREIDRSQGRRTGSGLAAAGVMTGLFGTGLGLVFTLGVVEASLPDRPTAEGTANASAATGAAPSPPIASGTRAYGTLSVVDLDATQPLAPQLREVVDAALASHRTVVLQTYIRASKECSAVAAALPDRRMQLALADVTLVRVDIETFERDLRAMRVETRSAPWFYKLDGAARPTDGISAAEWDENVPENMAPILGPFVRGARRAK